MVVYEMVAIFVFLYVLRIDFIPQQRYAWYVVK